MAGTGWIWVTTCLVALVASQSCPDQDSSLKKWSDDATWNGEVCLHRQFKLFFKVLEKKDNELLSNSELICLALIHKSKYAH